MDLRKTQVTARRISVCRSTTGIERFRIVCLLLFLLPISLKASDAWVRFVDPAWMTMNAIAAQSRSTWLVGGDRGVWRLTRNSGTTWDTGQFAGQFNISGVAIVDSATLLCCGNNGVIMRSIDFGHSWREVFNDPTHSFAAVAFTRNGTGVCVGSGGNVVRTTDSGESWLNASRTTTNDLHAVACSESGTFVAVGDSGAMTVSRDAGVSWTSTQSGVSARLRGLAVFDSSDWYVGGDLDSLLTTTNGGKDWRNLGVFSGMDSLFLQHMQMHVFSFLTQGIGIVSLGGADGSPYRFASRTLDAGKSWSSLGSLSYPVSDQGLGNYAEAMAWVDSSSCVATGRLSQVSVSSDTGHTWQTVHPYSWPAKYGAVSFADSLHGMVISSDQLRVIRSTTDGGATWNECLDVPKFDWHYVDTSTGMSHSGNYHFQDIAHPTPMRALVIADSGELLRTFDGGRTWRSSNMGVAFPMYIHLSMFDSLNGILGGGTQDAPLTLLATHDGGDHWQKVGVSGLDSTWGIRALQCSGKQEFKLYCGTMMGDSSYYCISSDGGSHWTAYPLANFQVSAAQFPDAKHGIVVGFQNMGGSGGPGRIAKTSDGGQNWIITRDADDNVGIVGVSFADSVEGLAVGGGLVLRTIDGGATWSRESIMNDGYMDTNFVTVAMPTKHRVVLVAKYGAIQVLNPGTAVGVLERVVIVPSLLGMPYPNPTSGEVTIPLTLEKTSVVSFSLFDCVGRSVHQTQLMVAPGGRSAVLVSLRGLPSGTYYFSVRAGSDAYQVPVEYR